MNHRETIHILFVIILDVAEMKAASFYIKFIISQGLPVPVPVLAVKSLTSTERLQYRLASIATPRHLFHHTTCSFSASFAHGIRVIL
jgi:hypothetical protein